MGKETICNISSANEIDEIYTHLSSNYSNNWERSNLTNYSPRYFINFGGAEIMVLKGGLVAIVPRPNDLFAHNGKVTFVRYSSAGETFKLIRHLCPNANPAGPYESPIVEIEIHNSSDQIMYEISLSGGGVDRLIESIEPGKTAVTSLVPQGESGLDMTFHAAANSQVKCSPNLYLLPGMNGNVVIEISKEMDCNIRQDSASLF